MLVLVIILPLIAISAFLSGCVAISGTVTHDVCLLFSKSDFQYHATDAADTKTRLQNDYAVLKSVCPGK